MSQRAKGRGSGRLSNTTSRKNNANEITSKYRLINEDEEDQEQSPQSHALILRSEEGSSSINKRKGRGKYKCISIDMKVKNGEKLQVDIPEDILRAVGTNARDLVNYCGFLVRTIAPLDVDNWNQAFTLVGDRMWSQIKEKFAFPDNSFRLQGFAIQTMQRLYRLWKSRLYNQYKAYSNDEERIANPPFDVPLEQWRYCMSRFGSKEFQEMSKRNSENRKKAKCKHTTGCISFAEKEYQLTQKNDNKKPTADIIWESQHTTVTKEGVVKWADPYSQEKFEEIKELVEQSSQDGANSMSQEDILLQVFKPKSGYFRGKGAGKQGYIKNVAYREQQQHNEAQQRKIEQLEKELSDVKALQQSQAQSLREEFKQMLASHFNQQPNTDHPNNDEQEVEQL